VSGSLPLSGKAMSARVLRLGSSSCGLCSARRGCAVRADFADMGSPLPSLRVQPSKSIPARLNSGSVSHQSARSTGPIRRRSITRIPFTAVLTHHPGIFARAADRDQLAQSLEMDRSDLRRDGLHSPRPELAHRPPRSSLGLGLRSASREAVRQGPGRDERYGLKAHQRRIMPTM